MSRRAAGNEQILCHLVRPKAQCPSRTFHDSFWAQTTEDTGLVVFTRVEVGDHGVVGSRQLCLTCWTSSLFRCAPVETGAADAVNTKDMTVEYFDSATMTPCTYARKGEYLQVVTRARSRSSTRHLISLHLRACSMLVTEVKARLWWSSGGASMLATP